MIDEAFVRSLVAWAEREGPRRWWRWDRKTAPALLAGLLSSLFSSLRAPPDSGQAQDDPDGLARVVAAFARLGCEAIGRGHLTSPDRPNFLTFCFTRLLPEKLGRTAPGQRMSIMSALWNVGEALAAGPAWLDRMVTMHARGWDDLCDVGCRIGRVLEPLASPPPPSDFSGPLRVTTLDSRSIEPGFLPGEVHAPQPHLVCVHDRLTHGSHVAVVLAGAAGAQLVGPGSCLGRADAPHEPVAFSGGSLEVRSRSFRLAGLSHGHSAVATSAGHVVATAVDSQRLWVVDCR